MFLFVMQKRITSVIRRFNPEDDGFSHAQVDGDSTLAYDFTTSHSSEEGGLCQQFDGSGCGIEVIRCEQSVSVLIEEERWV